MKEGENPEADLQLQIMQYNYWEHFKFEKDLAMVLPVDHPKRVSMRKATQDLLDKIHTFKNSIES